MSNMKKISLLLFISIVFILSACGSDKAENVIGNNEQGIAENEIEVENGNNNEKNNEESSEAENDENNTNNENEGNDSTKKETTESGEGTKKNEDEQIRKVENETSKQQSTKKEIKKETAKKHPEKTESKSVAKQTTPTKESKSSPKESKPKKDSSKDKSQASKPSTNDKGSSSKPKEEPKQETVTVSVVFPSGVSGQGFSGKTVTFSDGDTAFDVSKKSGANIGSRNQFGNQYVHTINGVSEFDHGPNSGWNIRVNGSMISVGSSSYKVKPGDKIEWRYTKDYTKE